ncbi:MAG TPA: FGGY-family carbohydrate kinase, partial [Actinomycetes bacterium]|nr:FGGY-family carbohydrate kinase [Actinomycetes bacterium]
MPEIRYLLALDLGTSGLKVAVTTLRGEIVTSAVERYPLHVLEDGGVEQDPGDWWDAIVRGTRRVLGHSGVDPGQVAGVACSSQWSGTVPVDEEGRPLMRAIIWMDARGAEEVHRITRGVPAVRGYGAAKLATWVHRSGGAPSRSGKDTLAHILFVRDRLPGLYRRTAKFLEPRDWLNFQLTGRMASSFDAATLLWAADTRDLGAVRYDPRLLGLTGLDRGKLPDLVPTASVLGTLAPPAAAALGLPTTAQVVSGAPDIMASAIEQESAGVCLAELGHNILFPPDGGGPPGVAEDPYPAMLTMAASVPAGSDGLIFAPWVNGERAPVDDRTVRGGFFNQSLGITRGHLVRAVLEGVAYNSRWLLGSVEWFLGRRLEAVTAVGGGARSELWCQIHADVLDRVVHQAAEPVLANARGPALQASVALGHLRWDEVAG